MPKNLLLALGLGAGMWAVMFIGVSAFMVMPIPLLLQQILEIILSGVAAFILARIYFKNHPGDIKDGLILGACWFVLGGILDLLVTVQYVKGSASYLAGLKMFYGALGLWIGFLLMFVGIVVAAKLTRGGELMKRPQVMPSVKPPQQPPTIPPSSNL